MYRVDLNSDLGESFGNYKIGMDDKVIPLIASANVACGYHASDPIVMDKTIKMAKEAGQTNNDDGNENNSNKTISKKTAIIIFTAIHPS